MGTGCNCSGSCLTAAIASTVTIAATASPTAAMSRERGGPSRPPSVVDDATSPTLGASSVGDGASQRAGDAGDLLDVRHDRVLQVAHRVGSDARHDVVRSSDVLGGAHTGEL